MKKIKFYENNEQKKIYTLKIHKLVKEPKGIKIFTELPNQGSFIDYISRKYEIGNTLTENNSVELLEHFVCMMKLISEEDIKAYGYLHIRNLFVHQDKLALA
eukprot:GHVR01062571.1.p1 GENE.GHVR01062571.1~~GHVR01062571.1.p1  ORF type:complete len:102 (-),score=9.27 GHVR01062571.1:1841-2146(-)